MDDLFSNNEPVWVQQARHLLGTQESPGTANNAAILDWARQEGGWIERFYTADSIPWCGLFVGHCLLNAGISGPKNPLSALAWADWGDEVPFSEREAGCVLVFTRQGGGHVGFTAGRRPWNPWYYGEWRAAEFLATHMERAARGTGAGA